jgi:hypothetical protein
MMNIRTLYERRDRLSAEIQQAAQTHDYNSLMTHTAEYLNLSRDIDLFRSAVARHVGDQLEQLSKQA